MNRSLLKAVVFAAAAALFTTMSALGTAASDTPDATISFSGATAAAGVGVTWGQGTLHFRGQDYPFKLQGLGVADLGGSSLRGTGEVYNLKKVEDFSGGYAAGSAAATAFDKGQAVTTMRNERGVEVRLKSTTQGLELKGAVEGMTITLGDAGR